MDTSGRLDTWALGGQDMHPALPPVRNHGTCPEAVHVVAGGAHGEMPGISLFEGIGKNPYMRSTSSMHWQPIRSFSDSALMRFGGAVVFVACAFILTLLLWPLVKPMGSPLFWGAIFLSAWWGGFRSGVLATIMAGCIIEYVFILPHYRVDGILDNVFRLTFFAAGSIVLSWLIDTRKIATEEIERSREQLRALSLHQQTVREAEQKRIALEIHDELGQALTSIKMDVYRVNRQIQALQDDTARHSITEKLRELLKLIDATIVSVRRIATELRPAVLDDFGVIAAIEWQARAFEKKTAIPCLLKSNVEHLALDPESTTAVFRIFQETLTNIARHAQASAVQVALEASDGQVILRVEDNGKGIHLSNTQKNHSLGILGMNERARVIGGRLHIVAGNKGGTTVELTIPSPENSLGKSLNGGEHDKNFDC